MFSRRQTEARWLRLGGDERLSIISTISESTIDDASVSRPPVIPKAAFTIPTSVGREQLNLNINLPKSMTAPKSPEDISRGKGLTTVDVVSGRTCEPIGLRGLRRWVRPGKGSAVGFEGGAEAIDFLLAYWEYKRQFQKLPFAEQVRLIKLVGQPIANVHERYSRLNPIKSLRLLLGMMSRAAAVNSQSVVCHRPRATAETIFATTIASLTQRRQVFTTNTTYLRFCFAFDGCLQIVPVRL